MDRARGISNGGPWRVCRWPSSWRRAWLGGWRVGGFLSPAHATFDDVALAVSFLVKAWVGALVLAHGDPGHDPAPTQASVHGGVAVALVAGQLFRAADRLALAVGQTHRLQRGGYLLALMCLARRDRGGQGDAAAIDGQMDLCAPTPARTAQDLFSGIVGPVFPSLPWPPGGWRGCSWR